MNYYKYLVNLIVRTSGGYREREIMENEYVIEKSETWNEKHRVLNVSSVEEGEDGYRDGFAIDLVTGWIVG